MLRYSIYALALILIFLSQVSQCAYGEQSISNISRLQVRQASDGASAWDQSTFVKLPNDLYFLELFDRQYHSDAASWHIDVNVGKPMSGLSGYAGKPVCDWVMRVQKYQNINPVMSAGLQWNITEDFDFKKYFGEKGQSFIQIFPLKTSNDLGKVDVVHYFNVFITERLTFRGYNQYIVGDNRSNIYYPWADVIYSVNKKIDVYTRLSYLSSQDDVLGNKGYQIGLGMRFNLSV